MPLVAAAAAAGAGGAPAQAGMPALPAEVVLNLLGALPFQLLLL